MCVTSIFKNIESALVYLVNPLVAITLSRKA